MNDYGSCAHCSSFYKQLKAIDDMKYYGHQLKTLGPMNSNSFWMIKATLSRELMSLNAMNN